MNPYSVSHLSNELLARDLKSCFARDHETSAALLARIAEFDDRKLYLPAGYPSMAAYCVEVGHMCEQAALKRIRVARTARRFPAIFKALAKGRLHLSAVLLLAPYLTEETAAELLAAAAHKSKCQIERLLADRFPKSDMLSWVEPVSPAGPNGASPGSDNGQGDPCQLSPGTLPAVPERVVVKPLSSQSFAVHFTISAQTEENVRYARTLLGHRLRSGDIGELFERAMAVYVAHLEKSRIAPATGQHRSRPGTSHNPRHIPVGVKQAVWDRDGGRCTFVSEDGHRCPAEANLEFDHITAVAQGGEASADNIRLLCRAHNQYAAERTFGAEFMRHKRISAAELRAAAKAARARKAARAPKPDEDPDHSVVPWLRALGFSAPEARRAAERCEHMPDAPVEEKVRAALSAVRVRGSRSVPAPSQAAVAAMAG